MSTRDDEDHILEFGDDIDQSTFDQILEMDDDEADREFSRSIVFGFFEQADETFKKMDKALEDKELSELSSLGHFLKGSSATLGMTKVQKGCEKIQHYGARQNDEGNSSDETDDKQIEKITNVLKQVRKDYTTAETKFKGFYAE